ncbi:MAG: hypothetical protein NTV68_00110, partial [Methanomicrobiales archaeon]|nr:hypothetical protein [Methanomicrobiales archaeon]
MGEFAHIMSFRMGFKTVIIWYCPTITYFINEINRTLLGTSMARPRGLIEVVCQNSHCDYFQKEEGK